MVGVDEVEDTSHSGETEIEDKARKAKVGAMIPVAVVLRVSVLVTLLFLLRVGVRLLFMLAVRSLTCGIVAARWRSKAHLGQQGRVRPSSVC